MSTHNHRLRIAKQLLDALRAAGSHAFVQEDQVFISPPSREVAWPYDPQIAVALFDSELRQLIENEGDAPSATVH
jgi:hypothetical protein